METAVGPRHFGCLVRRTRETYGKRQSIQPPLCGSSGILIPDMGAKPNRWAEQLSQLLNGPLDRAIL